MLFACTDELFRNLIPSFFICSNNNKLTTCNFTEHNEQDNRALTAVSAIWWR